jgi:REP element-mobilizing transposase RayT
MTAQYNPERHHRRSIRLRGYDYTQPGAHFVTICTSERACLFGEVNVIPRSLGAVVRSFKSATTKRINEHRSTLGAVWQRNYYEHIIRNEESLQCIRRYIQTNPLRWHLDRENPDARGVELQGHKVPYPYRAPTKGRQ